MNDSKTFLKVIRDPDNDLSWNRYDVIPLGGNGVRIKVEKYDLTPEIQTTLSDAKYKFN